MSLEKLQEPLEVGQWMLYTDQNTRVKDLPVQVLYAHGHGQSVEVRVLVSWVKSYEEKVGDTGRSQWVVKEFHRDQEITVNARALRMDVAALKEFMINAPAPNQQP